MRLKEQRRSEKEIAVEHYTILCPLTEEKKKLSLSLQGEGRWGWG
jgi:hypothetical protein